MFDELYQVNSYVEAKCQMIELGTSCLTSFCLSRCL